jgi:uncharacterized membrane protein YfcA
VGIFLIAASGFAANAHLLSSGDLVLGAWFLAGSAAGMTGGSWLKIKLPARGLRMIFAISVLCVAAYVVLRNVM